jgi:hypothetical protein
MILTADSTQALQTQRRKTGNGWHTTFIGENRMTRDPGAPEPDGATLFPMAFLVEKEPGAVVKPHFHRADQYQVVVSGGGRMGRHALDGVEVHYTDAYSAYGPIVAADDGIAWFTLRNAWDPGARYMTESRAELRAARAENYQHREAVAGAIHPLSDAALGALNQVACTPVLGPGEDGLATWHCKLPPSAELCGPDPATGGGQFWIVLAGSLAMGGSGLLPPKSCAFVAPEDAPLAVHAGVGGAEALCLQFPHRPWHGAGH